MIYIVKGTTGDYEDTECWNVGAFHTEERANEFICKLNELATFDCAFNERMRTEFELPYRATLEWPTMPPKPETTQAYRLVAAAGIDGKGSLEDTALYTKLQSDHMAKLGDWRKEHGRLSSIYEATSKKFEAAKQEWKQANYNPPEHLKEVVRYSRDNRYETPYYDYEEVELLP